MTGEAHWITLILFAVVTGGVTLLFVFKSRLEHRFRNRFRRARCPESRHMTEQTVVEDARTGELTGVTSCSEFATPTAVSCDRACIKSSHAHVVSTKIPSPATRS